MACWSNSFWIKMQYIKTSPNLKTVSFTSSEQDPNQTPSIPICLPNTGYALSSRDHKILISDTACWVELAWLCPLGGRRVRCRPGHEAPGVLNVTWFMLLHDLLGCIYFDPSENQTRRYFWARCKGCFKVPTANIEINFRQFLSILSNVWSLGHWPLVPLWPCPGMVWFHRLQGVDPA